MMNSCKVFIINEALSKDDVSFAAKPTSKLRAVPFGSAKKQLVRSSESIGQDVFSIFDASTSLPASITGMALFLTISNSDGVVFETKGKVNSDIKGMVSFKQNDLEVGFYSYEITARASKGYCQSLLSGSYVVQP
jgi:hypothetical protein